MFKSSILILLSIFMSGCMSTFHTKPYVAYENKHHPLSDTSVFTTDGGMGNSISQILSVNGVETSCWEVGCPIWVRVKPGVNKFTVKLSVYDNGIASYKVGVTEVTINDMKPKHVYKAKFDVVDREFKTMIEDLGENPEYGIHLGLEGFNKQYYPVEF
ncbi:hypothetical protein N480_00840 [Pseudoalteromonas luteoviolacea S2607]|uniref:hypothetical protein n=1 Tax=Pseudoalteromonas luteoviolacea TaxID=43657 RepID=UPI0007B0428A|nr:hypothetical protein [Pseudoalteromonas luteoviolacea]KZN39409.1 hypothetical protein N480_00840 [Pseudoalteromonas luteoviolacea S2607]